jgi:hypothetical protein
MKLITIAPVEWLLLVTTSAAKAQERQPQPRVVELKASDGTLLKGTFSPLRSPAPACCRIT